MEFCMEYLQFKIKEKTQEQKHKPEECVTQEKDTTAFHGDKDIGFIIGMLFTQPDST